MDLNKANREVCNVVILDYKTDKPYMKYKLANTTGLNISSDSVYAMGHGSRKIAFPNPLEGQITITAQVLPYKVYALYSDGVIDTSAEYYLTTQVKCTTAGELPLAVSDGTIIAGTVFVYAEGDFGGKPIEGTYATDKFKATTSSEIENGKTYEIGFMLSRETGVQKITLNNERKPKDVKIYMDTFDKDEEGNTVPFRINVHKASIQRNVELSFSSEGDPQEITLTFDVLEDDKDDFVDFVEITEDTVINPV